MATLTINHYINQSNSFITDVRNNRNAYYMFASRSQPWANSSGGNDDSAVLASNNSVSQVEQTVYNDVLFGKLLKDADVINVVPRYNWTSGTVYAPYDQNDANLYDKQFYVVTDQYEVYKCIDNNNAVASTVKPSLTSATGTFKTGDGYVWKYMYSISSSSNTKFATVEYIPVDENLAVQGNATPGSIDLIKVTDGGNGYSVFETGYITGVDERGSRIQLPLTSSSVNNYYTNSSIYLKSGFGAGQIREIATYNGASKQIVVAGNSLDLFTRLDLANVTGTIATGYYAQQRYDDVRYLYSKGYFNVDSNVAQSDTGVSGRVIAANSSVIQVIKTNQDSLFQATLPIVDVSQAGTQKTGTANVGNVGSCSVAFVVSSGSGYSANAVVTITPSGATGSGGVANALVGATGKVSSVLISTAGSGYFTAPTLTIAAPTPQNITANTAGVNNAADVLLLASANSRFLVGDRLYYGVPTGNTAIPPLTGNSFYFVTFSNTTALALSATSGGANININTAVVSNPGQTHTLTGETATAVMFCDNQIVRGNGATLNSATIGYANGDYIRVGANTTSNIRRVANAVNTSVLIVSAPFGNTFAATTNNHFKMVTVAEVEAEPLNREANGFILDTNLTSVQLAISNSVLPSVNFIVGENVKMTNSTRIDQGATATIAFANSSTVILSNVSGTWLVNSGGTQLYVSGDSSLQLSRIDDVLSNPNITIEQQRGVFKIGYPIFFKANAQSISSSGDALIVAQFALPNDLTEYQIGPTVKITGDGANALGIATVNTAVNSIYNIVGIDMIDAGIGYTQANVVIYANTSHGSGAKARAIISPVNGHGHDPVTELGGRYVGVSSKFDSIQNESFEFPGYGSFRQVGILENPQFKDIRVTLTDFDRVNMSLTSAVFPGINWNPGEVVVQSTTNAAGVVVYGNSTFLQLKSVKGTFNTGNAVYGYYSTASANLATADVIRFPVGNSASFVTQSNSGSTGVITEVISNTVYSMSNVVGQFADGDVMYDNFANAFATVESISTANGTKDVSSSFGLRFNQTARITLTSRSGLFANNEYVQQAVSLARGRVVSTTDEVDLVISSPTGPFFVGQTVTDLTTNANGICVFANSSYLKLSAVSQGLSFGVGDTINNGLGSNAAIATINPVLVLNDISDVNNFQAGSNTIVGLTSGATATCNNQLLIRYPDLVRDSGKLIYSESFTYVTRTPTSKEEVKLVIKF